MASLPQLGQRGLTAWHLWSMDAPSVLVAWMLCSFAAAHRRAPLALLMSAYAATWTVYALDRRLDAVHPDGPRHPRHLWARQHGGLLRRLVPATLLVAAVCLCMQPASQVKGLLWLTAIFAAWFAAVHLSAGRVSMPKEAAVGAFFAMAAVLPALDSARRTQAVLAEVLLWGCFAILAAVNATLITRWEGELGQAHPWTRVCSRAARPLLLGAAMLPVLLMVLATMSHPHAAFLHLAACVLPCAVSAVLLLLLDLRHTRLSATTSRAAADAVLLVPAVAALPCMSFHAAFLAGHLWPALRMLHR